MIENARNPSETGDTPDLVCVVLAGDHTNSIQDTFRHTHAAKEGTMEAMSNAVKKRVRDRCWGIRPNHYQGIA